jgi:hypothetical protein
MISLSIRPGSSTWSGVKPMEKLPPWRINKAHPLLFAKLAFPCFLLSKILVINETLHIIAPCEYNYFVAPSMLFSIFISVDCPTSKNSYLFVLKATIKTIISSIKCLVIIIP